MEAIMIRVRYAALLFLGCTCGTSAFAAPADDVGRDFDQFVAAQNAHDLPAVRRLLADGPQFLWVTRGVVVRGSDAAIERFRDLYKGTWNLTVTSKAEIFAIDRNNIQLIAPVTFSIGAPGSAPTETRFILTQLWHRQGGRWRISSLLPIAAPAS
jgi:ketosteroid isomerase-like protein